MTRIAFLLLFAFLFTFCKHKSAEKGDQKTTAEEVVLEKDFIDFYKRFHEDSLFQIAHVQWPLPGKELDLERKNGSLQLDGALGWTPEDWDFQRLPALNTGEFARDFEPMGADLMIETIRTTGDVKYAIVRRWAKMSGEWRLIFYSAGMIREAPADPMR